MLLDIGAQSLLTLCTELRAKEQEAWAEYATTTLKERSKRHATHTPSGSSTEVVASMSVSEAL